MGIDQIEKWFRSPKFGTVCGDLLQVEPPIRFGGGDTAALAFTTFAHLHKQHQLTNLVCVLEQRYVGDLMQCDGDAIVGLEASGFEQSIKVGCNLVFP